MNATAELQSRRDDLRKYMKSKYNESGLGAACVTIQPTGSNILITPMTDEESVGGIFIPEAAREKPQQGFVAALGSGQRSIKGGNLIPWDVKVGDRVLLRKFHGTDIRVEDKVFKMVTADDLLAVLVG